MALAEAQLMQHGYPSGLTVADLGPAQQAVRLGVHEALREFQAQRAAEGAWMRKQDAWGQAYLEGRAYG